MRDGTTDRAWRGNPFFEIEKVAPAGGCRHAASMSAKHFILLCLAGLFTACAAPDGGVLAGSKVSTSRDEYGHRPAPKVFRR